MRQGDAMYFVGVDLAWGDNKPTGLAVLDDGGRLVTVSAARDDDEIVAALAQYVAGDCLVAIDAPLVVVNPTGNRPCEAALNRDFARFDAGAHPSNTGKPEFSDTPRGARLATRLGLDIDPDSTVARRAIEVYPHPATVALFRLGRTLKYKNKPGRTLTQLRASCLLVLMHRSRASPTRPRRCTSPTTTAGGPWSPRWRTPSARATCAGPRTRSTRWCAPTSRCSPTAAPS